jgi:Protein of unknown function (DUF1360)
VGRRQLAPAFDRRVDQLPFCLAVWVATGLTGGLVLAPRLTRLTAAALTATAASDFLRMAYSIAKESGGG